MDLQVIVDFDATITLEDSTDQLLQRFADPAWTKIEADWAEGRIGSRACMTEQVALIRATPQEIDAYAAGVAIDWHFKSFERMCGRLGIPLMIVSDGLDRVIARVLAKAGLDHVPVAANHLAHEGADRWRLAAPHAAADCASDSATCKCAVAGQRGPRPTLLIGDGRSDYCLAARADFVFAKCKLLRHCQRGGIAHTPFADFADAAGHLIALFNAQTAAPRGAREMMHG